MSVRVSASAVISSPIDQVWAVISSFSFPGRVFPGVGVTIEEGDESRIGCVRKLEWASQAQWRRDRLLLCDELTRRVAYEMVEESQASEVAASLSIIELQRVTEENGTFVRWTSEFAAGTVGDLLKFQHRAIQENLRELRRFITGQGVPSLQHVIEGPSSRVVWLAKELAIPLDVTVVEYEVGEMYVDANEMVLTNSAEAVMFQPAGAIMPTFTHDGFTIIESGAILLYLLEQFDRSHRFHPAPSASAQQRARFNQWMFFAASTCDPLLMEAYIHSHVLPEEQRDAARVDMNLLKWQQAIAQRIVPQLSKGPFLCGDQFSGVDIMMGHTIHFAHTLGWLEGHPLLCEYYERISKRWGFQSAYTSYD